MSTPLDRLKEAFPESKWTIQLYEFDGRWRALAQDNSYRVKVAGWGHDADEAATACIAKAREVGINSDENLLAVEGHGIPWYEVAPDYNYTGALVAVKVGAGKAALEAAEAHADRLACLLEDCRPHLSQSVAKYQQPTDKQLLASIDQIIAAHDARRGKA